MFMSKNNFKYENFSNVRNADHLIDRKWLKTS